MTVTINGTTGITTPALTNEGGLSGTTGTFSGLISANGGQIKFPATQSTSSDANTLDDYEEGTWTPTVSSTGTAPTITGFSSSGWYTKVGNLVTCYGIIYWTSRSGGTGDLIISIPFDSLGTVSGGGASFNGLNLGAAMFGSMRRYTTARIGFLYSNLATGGPWTWMSTTQTPTGSFDLNFGITFTV